MADDYTISLEDEAEGHSRFRFVPEDGDDWLDRILERKPGSAAVKVRLAGDGEDDTEGHGVSTRMRVIVDADDDTEGHAISIHFPTLDDADAFRRRMLATGVLVGSIALGAGAGIGLSSMASNDAGTAGAASSTATGSAWTQDERAGMGAAAASSATGSAWTQDERAGLGAAAASSDTGSAWTQDERQPAAGDADAATPEGNEPAGLGGPQPR
jgi:hypothetical protein